MGAPRVPTETEAKQEQATKEGDLDLTPPYLRYLIRLIRPFPDFDFFFVIETISVERLISP
jgi:hypothetical protein